MCSLSLSESAVRPNSFHRPKTLVFEGGIYHGQDEARLLLDQVVKMRWRILSLRTRQQRRRGGLRRGRDRRLIVGLVPARGGPCLRYQTVLVATRKPVAPAQRLRLGAKRPRLRREGSICQKHCFEGWRIYIMVSPKLWLQPIFA